MQKLTNALNYPISVNKIALIITVLTTALVMLGTLLQEMDSAARVRIILSIQNYMTVPFIYQILTSVDWGLTCVLITARTHMAPILVPALQDTPLMLMDTVALVWSQFTIMI